MREIGILGEIGKVGCNLRQLADRLIEQPKLALGKIVITMV